MTWQVRSASGDIVFANRAAAAMVGLPAGSVVERWQVTPRATRAEASEGELDLPRKHLGKSAPPELPPPTERHPVLLLDRAGQQHHVLSMTRTPFWLVDRHGAQHALVMYSTVFAP
jgi:hypothetical protein